MNRERVSLECPECGNRNYRTSRKTKGTYKLDLPKYCPTCRKHVEHKEKKKSRRGAARGRLPRPARVRSAKGR